MSFSRHFVFISGIIQHSYDLFPTTCTALLFHSNLSVSVSLSLSVCLPFSFSNCSYLCSCLSLTTLSLSLFLPSSLSILSFLRFLSFFFWILRSLHQFLSLSLSLARARARVRAFPVCLCLSINRLFLFYNLFLSSSTGSPFRLSPSLDLTLPFLGSHFYFYPPSLCPPSSSFHLFISFCRLSPSLPFQEFTFLFSLSLSPPSLSLFLHTQSHPYSTYPYARSILYLHPV